MNAEWLGRWDVAPRSHPSDGRIEVFDARLPRGDKLEAARRLRTGSHLPHPNIAVSVVKRWETQLDPGTKVWLDGRCVGAARTLRIVVHPDAISAVV
jgi:diacylglycerol kinase family enzyme